MEKVTSKEQNAGMVRSVGRRKTAASRVRLSPGTGQVTVNGRPLSSYFPLPLQQQRATAPLLALGKEKHFDVTIKAQGGGISGQAESAAHGIARALVLWNPDFHPVLRSAGFLTRDPRAKERKKFGRRRARRSHQWRKR